MTFSDGDALWEIGARLVLTHWLIWWFGEVLLSMPFGLWRVPVRKWTGDSLIASSSFCCSPEDLKFRHFDLLLINFNRLQCECRCHYFSWFPLHSPSQAPHFLPSPEKHSLLPLFPFSLPPQANSPRSGSRPHHSPKLGFLVSWRNVIPLGRQCERKSDWIWSGVSGVIEHEWKWVWKFWESVVAEGASGMGQWDVVYVFWGSFCCSSWGAALIHPHPHSYWLKSHVC